MKRGKDMNATQPQTEHLSDVEDIKREPKKHRSRYSKKELDPSTTGHTDTKVTLPPHHTRAVTAATAAWAVIPKEEKVKVMWDANPAWTWHLVNYFKENVETWLKFFSDSSQAALEEGQKKVCCCIATQCKH